MSRVWVVNPSVLTIPCILYWGILNTASTGQMYDSAEYIYKVDETTMGPIVGLESMEGWRDQTKEE